LVTIFRNVPVVQNDPNWRCRTWVANVLSDLARDGKAVGTSELSWQKIEATARRYVDQKTSGGRYGNATALIGPRPTWDMIDDKEIIP
jgi:hypothetical protein